MKIGTVYIEVTNRCNLNCTTCYNRSGLNWVTQEITVEQLEHAMRILSHYGAKRFLFSGGEPSLHSQFHQILELTERYPNYSYGFVTNGTNHDPIWINYLNIHTGITLQISLDGADEEQNRLTRGSGNFEKTSAFLKKLKSTDPKPLLKAVISQNNINCVEAFYRLAVSLGCIPEFAFIYRSGNGAENWNDKALSAQQKLKILKQIDSLNRQYGINAELPKCTFNCPLVSADNPMSICIKPNGDIQPCQSLYSPEFSLGNIFCFEENTFTANADHIAALARQRTSADYGCQRCMLNSTCGRGCMAEAFHNCGDALGNDGSCTERKLWFLNFEIKKLQELHQ